MRVTLAGFSIGAVLAAAFTAAQPAKSGVALADLSWKEAEAALTPSSVVVIPLGAAAVQHGPHLKLNHNERIARYVAARVQASASVVVAPLISYSFYPSFLEYPGSTSLTDATARNMTIEIVRSLARTPARRFYVLNIGVPTQQPLAKAAQALADEGILLGYTDLDFRIRSAPAELRQTPVRVAHADEAETSMMLYVDPSAVDMSKAVREYGTGSGPMTRKRDSPGVFSESGVLGDATLATKEKGRILVESLVAGVLDDIETLRSAPLPIPKTAAPPVAPPAARSAQPAERRLANGCTPGDERTIREIGPRFSSFWRQMDAVDIGLMFSQEADMRHPDGTIERTRDVIRQNREQLFLKPEYRGSVHPVTIYDVRCLGPNHAIADGKWELRFADGPGTSTQGRPPSGAASPTYSGLFTLVLSGAGSGWSIEAWRYTVNPQQGPPPPTILKQPGFIGRGH